MDKQRIENALNGAIASRGKNKGRLKASCPPMGTDSAIMWQALQMNMNPYKVGMGHLMLMTVDQQAFYKDCLALSDSLYAEGYRLDRDQVNLASMGVW